MINKKAGPEPESQGNLRFFTDVLLRALLLLVVFNLIFALFRPGPMLGKISGYNTLFPGRLRLPYGENPAQDYNLSLSSLEAMFAAHEISGQPKSTGEYRVILIGDSSTWGFLLPPGETLSEHINRAAIRLPDGRTVRAFNLGYPVMSLAKDLLILHEAMAYEPDLILWPLTLESLPEDKQLSHPLLLQNPEKVQLLNERYELGFDSQSEQEAAARLWNESLLGRRRELADMLRLQLYGVMWAATGIDHEIPGEYLARLEDLTEDFSFHDIPGPPLDREDLAFDLLAAGHRMAGEVPVLLVNEPMFISQGKNSHIRYNFFYPRWVYDDYRSQLNALSQENGWHYLDLWDAVDGAQFTNTAIHMTPAGTQQMADQLVDTIIEIAGSSPPAVDE